ncbi:hypothetical protein [Halorarum salinum]|uniref:Uncharacterized protein n=1 Tax=Halorarum salinum TaxID=2743089 RepID=A0A7D5L8Q4_9EURY|nr:hypothetical protein [Halobaculum salinum]QLG60648.1 hypothetical protein HUG12_02355 [Halobaculum salinum]
MNGPIRRRNLLTGVGLSGILAGCLGTERLAGNDDAETTTEQTGLSREGTSFEDRDEPPDYDCETADRPEPDAPDTSAEEAVEPTSYPDPLDSFDDDDSTVEYVEAYERAYRRNTLVAEWGARLTQFFVGIEGTKSFSSPGNAALVRIQYHYSETVERSGGTVIGDSPTIFVTYYLDQSVLIRAESSDRPEDLAALDPDPWLAGDPVECFE